VWAVAGPDPGARRSSVPVRLVILGVSIAAHATLSQLMYAGLASGVTAPAHEIRGAATIMYYGGDSAEIMPALALLANWRPRRTSARRARRDRCRTPSPHADEPVGLRRASALEP
jgi:putative membrane protein